MPTARPESEAPVADLYLMCGICGSGKSYFAKRFAELNGFRYLNIDDCYAVMNGDERIHENKFDVWQLYYRLIYQANKLGQTAVVDTNAPYRSDREEILNWFSGFDRHRLIWVNADAELAWRNNCSRRRVMPRQSFDNVLKSFCPPDQNEPSARAGWNSIVRIDNLDNHFQPPVLIRGEPLSPALKLWDEKEN